MGSSANVPTLKGVHDAYQALYDCLKSAYWAASTISDKDRIHGVMDLVFDALTDLNRASIQADTPEFKAARAKLKTANEQITVLKKDLNELIAAVKTATQVASAADKAISLAVKYFGL
jgi:hypothetical protein